MLTTDKEMSSWFDGSREGILLLVSVSCWRGESTLRGVAIRDSEGFARSDLLPFGHHWRCDAFLSFC
jgi:hypothetical protein